MRVSAHTLETLTSIARRHFGDAVEVRLFGSRVNDLERGGDIDIQVVAPEATYRDEIAFLVEVERQLDERVDLRVQRKEKVLIDEIARKRGVLLSGR